MSAFALLCRGRGDRLEILTGQPLAARSIADLPADREVVAAVPFRQITERGLPCVDDGEPLLAFAVRGRSAMPMGRALRHLPDDEVRIEAGGFDVDDEEYEAIVRDVIADDIGRGTGSNFVIRREFRATIAGFSRRAALAVFRRLLVSERGAYWTFLVHCDGRTLIGASPECHARLSRGIATMNPISGTYRYPPGGPTRAGLQEFLADRKEAEELFMVVDEELKTMARVCDGGGRLRGPWLRPMSRLAHTEYVIEGPSRLGPLEVLRETLPAPTVTGSPLTAACRAIAAHERTGRGFYAGALALIGPDSLDSALLIRTADIDAAGRVRIGVGATLVRHSDPAAEAAETRAKAAVLIGALTETQPTTISPAATVPAIFREMSALTERNNGLSHFWRGRSASETQFSGQSATLSGKRILVIDAEDDFTAMLAEIARALGLHVRVQRYDTAKLDGHDAVIVGPGPGDPDDHTDPRIARLHEITRELLSTGTPFLSVCLGHQVLATQLGLRIRRLEAPQQGVQRVVAPFGRVGFYNTFAAVSDTDTIQCPHTGAPVTVLRDPATGIVHALRRQRVRSMQFHVESVLTEHGPAILRHMLADVLTPESPQSRPNGGSPRAPESNRICA